MWHLGEPSPERIRDLLAGQAGETFSCPAVGATRREPAAAPRGYDLDHSRILLGRGSRSFEAAAAGPGGTPGSEAKALER